MHAVNNLRSSAQDAFKFEIMYAIRVMSEMVSWGFGFFLLYALTYNLRLCMPLSPGQQEK